MDKIFLLDLGRMGYRAAWDLQKVIHQKRVEDKIPDTLILVEHDPVVTMGKSGKENNLLLPVKLLKDKGVEFFNIERGGDVTYHGPGQLVGYPIFNVRKGLAGIKPFIGRIEEAIVLTLKNFGITAYKKEKLIGVWTDAGKICSIGVAVQRWVSFHGFALNVNTDLNFFNYIVPCGLAGVKMTSMKEILNNEVGLDEVKNLVRLRFGVPFGKEIEATCLNAII
jgi:lipoate-protein ligase B